MTFSNLGFYYLEPGQSLDVEFWWGQGNDQGAVFAMARFLAQTSGLVPVNSPPPSYEFTTSDFRSRMHFTFDVITATSQQFSDPWQSYVVSVSNTGQDPGYFRLDGMTSID